MTYSYFGWEDEFKGLTKDTNFSGSAAEEDSKPQGLGSKPKAVETSEGEDTQGLNLFSIIKRIANNFAESVDNDEERIESVLTEREVKGSNLSTFKKTNAYLAQQNAKQVAKSNYLKKIINVDVRTDVFDLTGDEANEPVDIAIFKNTATSNGSDSTLQLSNGTTVSSMKRSPAAIDPKAGIEYYIESQLLNQTPFSFIGEISPKVNHISEIETIRNRLNAGEIVDFSASDTSEIQGLSTEELLDKYNDGAPFFFSDDLKRELGDDYRASASYEENIEALRNKDLQAGRPGAWEIAKLAANTFIYDKLSFGETDTTSNIKGFPTLEKERPPYTFSVEAGTKPYEGGLSSYGVNSMLDLGASNVTVGKSLPFGATAEAGTLEGLENINKSYFRMLGPNQLGGQYNYRVSPSEYGLGGNVNLGDFDVSVDYSSLGGASGGVKYEKNLDFLGGNLQFKANAGSDRAYGAGINFKLPLGGK